MYTIAFSAEDQRIYRWKRMQLKHACFIHCTGCTLHLIGAVEYRSDARYKSNAFIANDELIYRWQRTRLSLKANAFSNRIVHI